MKTSVLITLDYEPLKKIKALLKKKKKTLSGFLNEQIKKELNKK